MRYEDYDDYHYKRQCSDEDEDEDVNENYYGGDHDDVEEVLDEHVHDGQEDARGDPHKDNGNDDDDFYELGDCVEEDDALSSTSNMDFVSSPKKQREGFVLLLIMLMFPLFVTNFTGWLQVRKENIETSSLTLRASSASTGTVVATPTSRDQNHWEEARRDGRQGARVLPSMLAPAGISSPCNTTTNTTETTH